MAARSRPSILSLDGVGVHTSRKPMLTLIYFAYFVIIIVENLFLYWLLNVSE